ncbi:MAG: hypothetical protein JSS91_04070 [Bacteroidetes bacterium]|nr:hypothetical protein [Bacteroidota bacterium]
MKRKVLTVFDDPGGGLAVTAVAEKLKENPEFELIIYCGKLSCGIADNSHLDCFNIDSMITKETAEEIIEKSSPDLLLSATGGGNAEQELRNTANRKNIPGIVILDFWKDYKRRWLYADYEIEKMKDVICVMDELTKKEMTEEGFPERNIIVTGHPHLDRMFNQQNTAGIRRDDNKLKALFLSQPFSIIGISEYKIHPLKLTATALKKYSDHIKKEAELTVRLHPSEKMSDEISLIIGEEKNSGLKIKLSSNEDNLHGLISDSDIVFGYNSIAMFEAKAFKKRAVSLDYFPMNESLRVAFASAGIESAEADDKALFETLKSPVNSISDGNFFSGGINNCIELIYSYTGIKKPVN